MDPPKSSSLKQLTTQGYVSKGLRPEAAEFVWEYTNFAGNGFATGIGLAVLVSMFGNDEFGCAFFLYIFGQQEFSVRICHEIFYVLTFDGFLVKGAERATVLNQIFWPVAGYTFGAITIRTIEFIFWIFGALLHFFLLFSALVSVLDLVIEEMLVGLPRNLWTFLELVLELPRRAQLRDLYRNQILKRLLNLWSFYRIYIHRRLLLVGVRMIETDIKVLELYYQGFQLLKQLIRTPTAILWTRVIGDAIEFGLGLLIIPEMHTLMYHYKPLGDKDIRLLRLTRKGLLGGVKRTLIHVPLSEAPAYECISYVWGDSTKNHSILIDDCQMPVSTNVYRILRARASIWSSRLLWIDAICINQDDNEEKTRQVRQMRTIYKSAYRVTVFLGSPPDARLAEFLLMKLFFRMSGYQSFKQSESIGDSYLRHQDIEGGQAPKEWVALKSLFSNPWFERAWVVQEVAMANNLCLLYGGRYLDWEVLMYIMAAFGKPEATMLRTLISKVDDDHLGAIPNSLLNGGMMGAFRQQFRAGETIKLHIVLRACLGFHATEPKDRIFALQGITEEASHSSLPIDYDLEVPKVLMNTARYFLQTPQSLEILQLAGIGWERDRHNMPSWVVDWTMTRPFYVLQYSNVDNSPTAFKASTQIRPHVHHDRDKFSLEMKGVLFDEIDEVGETIRSFDFFSHHDDPADLRDINRMWVSWFRRAEDIAQRRVPDPYHTGQRRLEAFWRTMMGDKDTSRPASPEHYFHYIDFKALCLKKVLEGTSTEREILTESERRFLRDREKDPRPLDRALIGGWAFSNAVGSACNDRRFAVTRKGYMAMAPLLTEPGDIVCLIFGADVPFILRKIPLQQSRERYDERQCYALVGESFVHGIMDGEGLEYLARVESWNAVEDFMVL